MGGWPIYGPDRKGIGSVAEIRGLLAPAADTPQASFGRYGYLGAAEQATRAYFPRHLAPRKTVT